VSGPCSSFLLVRKAFMNWMVLTWCCRLLIGGVLLASALGKSLDLLGFIDVLVTYQLFPDWSLRPLAFGITGIEWVLAVWILVGWRLSTGALLSMMLNGLYAVGLIVTLIRGLDLPNCGCYGVFFPQPLRWYSPLEDLVLVGICYALRAGAQPSPRTLDKVF
jgi:Methylamine utilisation protein MauE